MNDLEQPPTSFSLRRRLLWIVSAMAVASLIVALIVYGHGELRSASDLAAVIAHLDETDPGWRLEEIEAARIQLHVKENSAALCRELIDMLGPKWPDPKIEGRVRDAPLGELLEARQKIILEDEMARLERVRLIARRIVAMPRGRFKVEYQFDPSATLAPYQVHLPKVEALFGLEIRLQANAGDVSEAVRASRACVCAARSLYDEVFPTAQTLRCRMVESGLDGVERSLALGGSNEAELVALDSLLIDEERHNTLHAALRGQRALTYLLYKRTAAGDIANDPCADLLHQDEWSAFGRFLGTHKRHLGRQIPGLLRMFTRAVENARLPVSEQPMAEAALESEFGEYDRVVALQLPGIRKLGEVCRRKTASVAAVRGLIAVERYRMRYKKWPANFAEVVPEYLDRVPTDPFDGKPLKMAKVADGVVVYSIGLNGVDDGGKLSHDHPDEDKNDIGYQLWDTAKRRRPASPPEPKPEEDEP